MELAGEVAVVTGAARGLGRAIAVALAREGADVAVSDIGRATDGTTPYDLSSSVLNPILAPVYGVPAERVFEEFVQKQTFLRRGQTPEEIAAAAVYLCRAENVTGITLTVAGGAEVH